MAKFYVNKEQFFNYLEKAQKDNKLNDDLKLLVLNFIEALSTKHTFCDYPEHTKIQMTNYAYNLFNRYWKNFNLYKEDGTKNNPYGYFYKTFERAFFDKIKEFYKKEKDFIYFYDGNNLDYFENSEDNIFELKNFNIKELPEEDIIYDINQISYTILSNLENISPNLIKSTLENYFNSKEALKMIKNDKILLKIIKIILKK